MHQNFRLEILSTSEKDLSLTYIGTGKYINFCIAKKILAD